jgi:hypothetical protein
MWKYYLLIVILFISCSSRKVALEKPDHTSARTIEPQELNLNLSVLHKITNLYMILCNHITQNDSVLIDSPAFDLIPEKQKEIIKECVQNAGTILHYVNHFPDDGRKVIELEVKGNRESDMLQLHVLERTFEKKGIGSAYSLKSVGKGKYEVENLITTFSF